MIIVGLLLVALICLAVGLILPSTAWLIASLIASVGAGYVLFRARTLIAGAHAVDGGGAGKATAVLDREPREPEPEEDVSPRRTRAQSRAEARAEARAAKATAAEERASADADSAEAATDFHDLDAAHTTLLEPVRSDEGTEVSGSELLSGISDEPAAVDTADAVADESAVDVVVDEPAVSTATTEANEGDVWVIDGRPRYHLATCAIIQGQDAEPIPIDQANEDGFMPCSLCEPNIVRATA